MVSGKFVVPESVLSEERRSGWPAARAPRLGNLLRLIGAASLSALLAAVSMAQAPPELTTSIFDGATPPAVAAGAPAGSFALSGFESVNLFTGKVNFSLPLLSVGGRGEAGYTMMLRLERSWGFDTLWICGTTNCDPEVPVHSAMPMETTIDFDPGYGPGVFTKRTGFKTVPGIDPVDCQEGDIMQERKLTRLTFMKADGTEISLRDEKFDGEPFIWVDAEDCPMAASPFEDRGRKFVAADGSAAIFVRDSVDGEDKSFTKFSSGTAIFMDPQLGPPGNMASRNGTIFRISGGLVSWIRDRNGNQTLFEYNGPGGMVSKVTDPLGRVVNVCYANELCLGTTTLYDRIVYTGAGGNERTIEVHWEKLYTPASNLFCSQLEPGNTAIENFLCPGTAGTAKTHDELFSPVEKGGDLVSDSTLFNPDLVSMVKLPNGKSYNFTYNVYGELYSVTLPTGGIIEYDILPAVTSAGCSLTSAPFCAGIKDINSSLSLHRRVTERREKANGGSTVTASKTFSFATSSGCLPSLPVGNECTEVTVKHYDGPVGGTPLSEERHHYYGSTINPVSTSPWEYSHWRTGKEFKTEIKSGSGANLRRTENVWEQRAPLNWWLNPTPPNPPSAANGNINDNSPPNDPRIANTDTYLLDGGQQVSRVEFDYSNDRYSNRTDIKQYAYGSSAPGGLLRWFHAAYDTSSTYTQSAVNFDVVGPVLKSYLPSVKVDEWICGAGASSCSSGSAVAKSNFLIDQGSLDSRSGMTGHDTTGFGSSYAVRGNVTGLRRWNAQDAVWISQILKYDIAGNVTLATDPNSNDTTISYTDDFTSGNPPSGSTFAFPTTIVRDAGGFNHTSTFRYDYNLGRQTEMFDENNTETTFAYADNLDRPTQIVAAPGTSDSAATSFSYIDTPLSGSVTTTQQQESCGSAPGSDLIISSVLFDGFGRQIESRQDSGPLGAVRAQQEYDGLGRVDRTSNPFVGASASDWTTTGYDALGRAIQVTHPDGSTATTGYVVNVTTVTGEAGKSRQNTTNALGQLTQVVEDPGGLGYSTSYQYDTLGNLTQASQTSQTRTFVYNSLSQLTSATNPESNTATFTYDANGNLLTKTDARTITATTGYDTRNRPISTSYTDGTTQPVTFCYEGKVYDPATGACANPSPAIPNSIARLTGVGSSVSATNFTDFDLLGRILASHQATGGFQYNFAYTYNLGGGLETQQYPSGLVAKTCYDAAGRITDVTNDGTSAPYASGITYAPHGAADKLTLGNGLHEATNFNNRLQPTQIGLGTTPGATNKLLLNFTYGGTSNNGNILTQTITPPGLTALLQNYTYDPVNRILTASEAVGANWSRTYDYDPYGNRAVIATSGLPTSPLMPGTLAAFSTATNRITLAGTVYDDAGNQIATALNETLVYDANNHQTSYFDPISAVTTTYEYDGQDNRVKKFTPSTSKTDIYVYDAFGKLAAEYSTVAPADPGTHYRTVDHLGSTRLVTDAAGTEIERRDYLPFGEEIPSNVGSRGTGSTSTLDDRHRFTGKERDTESQLDYFLARYYSSPMGRFLSVDPNGKGARAGNPQTWNAYAYVNNSPLALVDPSGNSAIRAPAFARQQQQLRKQAQEAPTVLERASARVQQVVNSPINDLLPSPFAVGSAITKAGQAASKFEAFRKTFKGGSFREITLKAGTQLKRAFQEGVNNAIGSFLTRGKTAQASLSRGREQRDRFVPYSRENGSEARLD